MRIVFAYYIATPFFLAALTILYLAWEGVDGIAVWIAPFLLILSFVWVFSPQINWWWYSKNPPPLEIEVAQAILQYTPFTKRLSKEGLFHFYNRVALTRLATDWTSKELPDEVIPPDMQTAVAIQSVICTWTQKDFIQKDFEKVILMPGPFLSPEQPSFHSAECYLPENCILLNATSVMTAFLQPETHFNVALYLYSEVTLEKHPEIILPSNLCQAFLSKMNAISGWNDDSIKNALGLEDFNHKAVLLSHYYLFYDNFKQALPEWTQFMDNLFFSENGLDSTRN